MKLKIVNDYHLPEYTARSGDGSSYTRLSHVEFHESAVSLVIFTPSENKEREFLINDTAYIELLPLLLSGKISCYQAMQNLIQYLSKKYGIELDKIPSRSDWGVPDEKNIMFVVHRQLIKEDDFMRMIQYFPHTHQDRFENFYQIPTQVASIGLIG